MADTLPPPTLTPGVKRTYEESTIASSSAMPQNRESSPAPSNVSSALSEPSSAISTPATLPSQIQPTQPPSSTSQPPAKKPKLTHNEKLVERAIAQSIKDEKARLAAEAKAKKAEEKARKDEEKAKKDEEKRRKAEENEERKRLREAEKAEKDAKAAEKKAAQAEKKAAADAEAAKKEAEKLKKERSQPKLSAFLIRSASTATPPATPDAGSVGPASRRSSVASIDMAKPEEDMVEDKPKAPLDDYIAPFFIKDHMELAPSNRFLQSTDRSASAPEWLDQSQQIDPDQRRRLFRLRRAKIRITLPIKDLILLSNGSSSSPVDLTSDTTDADLAIRRAPFKMLQFREDIRPPYLGTYTRAVSPRTSRKLSRVPQYRGLPDTDYDYDSEAEWQEPEADDEDLENEENESEEEDGPDDMDDFLDDEADGGKRAPLTADAEPVSTGLCWEGETALLVGGLNLGDYQMQVMHDSQILPIDPYSSFHWSGPTKTEKKAAETSVTAMQPPRLPLANVSVNTSPKKFFMLKDTKQSDTVTASNEQARPAKSDKPVQFIPNEFLPAFKQAVQGSDLNQNGLVEILKKQFPACKKPAIKDTLKAIARREGAKEADKRWVLIDN